MRRNSGIAFHCHHNKLAEFVYDYKGRIQAIKSSKPKKEQDLRLRLFKLIPLKKLPSVLRKADAEWDKAYAEWDKADAEWKKAYAERLHKELCPDCPWDGVKIFTRKNDKGEWY